MRLLSLSAVILALLASCAPRGAVTPEDAYYMLRKACRDGDGPGVERLLSQRSHARVLSLTATLARMDDGQAEGVAKEMGVPRESLRTLTVKDFLSLQLRIERDTGGKALWPLVSRRIAKTTIKGDTAAVITEDGVEMKLVREGPYWKLDGGIF
ncbi:MAG: hypothetical protein KBA61_12095 [Spirochaetes bacterium]|nr:hypothetical protein [Spirochaetota bacterium]